MTINTFYTFIFLCICAINAITSKSIDSTRNDLWLNHLECVDEMLTMPNDSSANCRFEIINKIDIHDLLDMALMNNNYRMIAADIFDRKYENKFVLIVKNSNSYSLTIDGNTVSHNIKINSIYLLLEYFGELISELYINFSNVMPDKNLEKCIELASRYCEKLRGFSVNGGRNMLRQVKNPFYNVTEVTFHMSEFETHTLSLAKIFPNVQLLQLLAVNIKNDDIFGHSLAKLEHLIISFGIFPGDSKHKKLIAKNHQIRVLNIAYGSATLVEFVSEHLPSLETFILPDDTTVDYTDEIHFKNVKSFEINFVSGGLMNITFERLEEFACDPDEFPNWIETIERHPDLRKLKFHSRDGFEDEYISLLGKIAKNLVEANFNCDNDVQIETIVNLLNECTFMERLYLSDVSKAFGDKLNVEIQDKWNLNQIKDDAIFIERR
ncbi:uncharacterized protein LOC116346300 [Contarinia nasturtii]|uniref:uncharacterized protein LOC116346300 n=1 Tax=Contarinia nasturtii TaxID=265458 RepID=UPI0012D4B06D|nr:uncharacterized protein LOC116346300 [Contarinia nasturtii]